MRWCMSLSEHLSRSPTVNVFFSYYSWNHFLIKKWTVGLNRYILLLLTNLMGFQEEPVKTVAGLFDWIFSRQTLIQCRFQMNPLSVRDHEFGTTFFTRPSHKKWILTFFVHSTYITVQVTFLLRQHWGPVNTDAEIRDGSIRYSGSLHNML